MQKRGEMLRDLPLLSKMIVMRVDTAVLTGLRTDGGVQAVLEEAGQ